MCEGKHPANILLFISVVMGGDNIAASIVVILGPKPSIPVALVESSLFINDKTWLQVINGNVKCEGFCCWQIYLICHLQMSILHPYAHSEYQR